MCSTMTGSSLPFPPRPSPKSCTRKEPAARSLRAPRAAFTRCSPRNTYKPSAGESMDKFRSYRITQLEKGVKSEFAECTLDELDPGEVVVRVAYADVNYKDALAATGKGRILLRSSCIGGIDLAGTVVSSSDPRLAKGDAVLSTGQD